MAFIQSTSLAFDQFPANSVIQPVECATSVSAGTWVYMDNSGIAQLALATTSASSNVIGICEAKLSVSSAVIRFHGLSTYVFAGLDTTKEYFLSAVTAGAMDITVPTNPGQIVLRLGQPLSATSFVVNKGLRMERT